ncbi:MBL fold metallo-hydrolase [Patulibacter sp. SYSU D01012]|uniref:MBL fold metallo-hydrolase n=1 Tax=Patulibacter sp. SYSU D01012 TaxID=2817381 RepID=UPI001B30A1BD
MGPVTAWLLLGDPLTLVDAGPASAAALVALEDGLAAHGLRVADLERVAFTHEHADHVGLGSVVAARSGAETVAIDALAGRLADPHGHGERETAFLVSVLVRHGVPRDLAVALSGPQRQQRAWAGEPLAVDHALPSGGTVALGGRTWELVLRPGHSQTDTLYVDRADGIVLGGDHLLARVSSNPLMACAPTRLAPGAGPDPGADDRVASLPGYVAGLRATAAEAPAVVLGGHGAAVDDAPALVAERLRGHERRWRRVAGLLAPEGSTAFAVAREMWGDTALRQPLLCVSEVLGHLDLLAREGGAIARRDGEVERWTAVG